jgi:hypothetical protein
MYSLCSKTHRSANQSPVLCLRLTANAWQKFITGHLLLSFGRMAMGLLRVYSHKYSMQVMLRVSTMIQFQSHVEQVGEAGFIAPWGHNRKFYGNSKILCKINHPESFYNAKTWDLRSIPLNINAPPNGTNCLVTSCKIGKRTLLNNDTK